MYIEQRELFPVQHRQDLPVEGIDNTVGSGDDSPMAALLNTVLFIINPNKFKEQKETTKTE